MNPLLLRDIRSSSRAGGGAMLALAFFAGGRARPAGYRPDLKLLARIAGGVLWIAALVGAPFSLDRLFQADFEDGSPRFMALSPLSLEATSIPRRSSRTG